MGILARNQTGFGPAIIQNVNSELDCPLNSLTEVARPGQTEVLRGSGLGLVGGDEAAGPLPRTLGIPVEVFVGGLRVNILYQGRLGCCVGVDQIVFEIPGGVEGCHVPGRAPRR